jgi:hypothetical protein
VDELDESELRDLRALLRILDKTDPWLTLVASDKPSRAWTAHNRSPLSTDDKRTHPYRVSHRAWMAINVAVDFLHCLRRSLVQELREDRISVRLHSYAQMGLLRGAVENACCAIWLLGPPRIERIANRLGLEWKELAPAYRLRELGGSQLPRTIEQRQQQLVDLLLAANLPYIVPAGEHPAVAAQRAARKALKGVDYVAMVKRAGELTPAVGTVLAEATWRMCSGLAHGDASATIGLLGAEVVEQVQPGIKLMRISAPVQVMFSATAIAYVMTARAFELLDARTQPPY